MILFGIFTRGITGLEMNWVGKKELSFSIWFYFRYMGGEPLDRSGGLNKVDSIAAILQEGNFSFGSCSEGTEKKLPNENRILLYRFKANVPIIPVAFDFGKKS
jgi:hypothetical protein